MPALLDAVTPITNYGFAGAPQTFAGAHTLAAGANLCYAVVSGLPEHPTYGIQGITVGGQAMTKLGASELGTVGRATQVWRLINPPTGPQAVVVTRVTGGYAPVTVFVVSILGGDIVTPDGGAAFVVATSPSGAPFTQAVDIPSGSGDLALSLCAAAPGASIQSLSTTAGYQAERAAVNDGDAGWAILGTSPGSAGTVAHRYDADFDTAGRGLWTVGLNINEGIAATTSWFLSGVAAGGSNHLSLVSVQPATATLATGWEVAGLAVGQHARMDSGTERLPAAFGATAQPDGAPDNTLGDAFRTTNPLTGTIPAGPWTLTLPLIAPDTGGANVRLRVRLWKGTNATGSGATEITAGAVVSTAVSNLQPGTPQTVTVAFGSLAQQTFTGDYLFLQVACETV